MKLLIPIFAVMVAFGAGCASAWASAPGAPTETRLVDWFEPLGVDTQAPRFGWVVNDDDRGEWQSAYQIVVATNRADLDNHFGSAWDSGKVASRQQFGITYAGAPLQKTSQYWWQARTWDKDDQVSPWSTPNKFVTGFFQASDWNAGVQWIRHPRAVSAVTDMPGLFRKTFFIGKPVKRAFLYATGLGQFVASLNGNKVGNHVIDPPWTVYNYLTYYVTFEVTGLVTQGTNVLGIMLGSGWLNAKDNAGVRPQGVERMLAQLHLVYADGTSDDVVSDPTWKVARSPFTYTDIHGVENYDARRDQAGWQTVAFDDSAWTNAVMARPSGGALAAQSSPPVVTQQVLPGVNISSPSANNYIFDLGKNMNGQFEIAVSGNAGARVTLTPGELLNGNGTVNPGRSGTMTYTLKGSGPEVWRQTFSTVGMRYVQVGGVATNAAQSLLPHIQRVTGYFTYTASASVGTFNSSDARYNAIHDLVLEAFRSNLASLHTDGPNYEKLGWQEVVWTTLFSTVYEHDLYDLYAKILRDVRVGQRTSGLCGTIAPNYFTSIHSPSGGMYDDAPDWGSAIFSAPWQIYQDYGDLKILADNYDAMVKYLAYLKSRETGAGVVTYDGLGDWMAPAGRSVPNVEGIVYVMDTRILRDVAMALGKAADASHYSHDFDRVQAAYNHTFFDAANARYLPVSQANLAMPLVFGLVPAGSEQGVAKALIKDVAKPAETTAENGQNGTVRPYHITAGDVGNTFVWQALGDYGPPDLVQTMILQSTPPGYLAMVQEGETSLAENWNVSNIRSHNHDMMGGIGQWFYRTVGGISSLQPGYAQIQLKPGMPSGLTHAAAAYHCVRGLIRSSWTRAADTIQWDVSVPVNATAKMYVPTLGTPPGQVTVRESGTIIFKNGAVAASVPGVAFDHAESGNEQSFIMFNVGSGSYHLAWKVQPTPTRMTPEPPISR